MGTGIHGYNGTKVAGAQGCQDLVGARHTHGTYLGQHRASQQKAHTVALEMDMLRFLMFLGTPGPSTEHQAPGMASSAGKSCWS